MIGSMISTTIFLLVQYGLIFFSAYYFTGKGIQDWSVNPMWEWLFYKLSGIGTFVYHLSVRVFDGICKIPFLRKFSREGSTTRVVLAIGWMVFVLGLMISFMNLNFYAWFGVDEIAIEIEDTTSPLGAIQNTMGFFNLLKQVRESENVGFFGAIFVTIRTIFEYIVFYILNYSIIFGFMESRMMELHIISGVIGYSPEMEEEESNSDSESEESEEPEESDYSISALITEIKNSAIDWLDNFAVLIFFRDLEVLLLAFIGSFAVSAFVVIAGGGFAISDLLLLVLGEMGIAQVIANFVIIVLFNLVVQYFTCYFLPSVSLHCRAFVSTMSAMATENIQATRIRRADWASNHDSILGSFTVRRMDLTGGGRY